MAALELNGITVAVSVIDRSGIPLDEMVVDPAVLLAGLGMEILIFAASMLLSIKPGQFQ